MNKQEKTSEAQYELQWIEAKIDLAVMKYENDKWLHKEIKDE